MRWNYDYVGDPEIKVFIIIITFFFKFLITGSGEATDLGSGAFCSEYG